MLDKNNDVRFLKSKVENMLAENDALKAKKFSVNS